jgi:enamine deaminase RidA (YjgF/YER057c/UK114 family)
MAWHSVADRSLPRPPEPQGKYVAAVVHNNLAFSAGMTPRQGGRLVARGVVGLDLSVEEARKAAYIAATNALTAIAEAIGGVERIDRCLKLTVYIACAATFTRHSEVADGASDALQEWLGHRSVPARAAIGVASLPSGAPVEVELTAVTRH